MDNLRSHFCLYDKNENALWILLTFISIEKVFQAIAKQFQAAGKPFPAIARPFQAAGKNFKRLQGRFNW